MKLYLVFLINMKKKLKKLMIVKMNLKLKSNLRVIKGNKDKFKNDIKDKFRGTGITETKAKSIAN